MTSVDCVDVQDSDTVELIMEELILVGSQTDDPRLQKLIHLTKVNRHTIKVLSGKTEQS